MQQYRSLKAKCIVLAKGFAMGLADIIPGVSGGTIALISGIYDHLIHAIGSVELRHALSMLKLIVFFWHGPRRAAALNELKEIEWGFLIPLLLGIVAALLIMTRIIPFVLENYAYYAYAFFFGLILFSISVPYRMMQRRWQEFAVMAAAAIAVFFLVGISRVSEAKLEFRALLDPGARQSGVSSRIGGDADHPIFTDAKGKWNLNLPLSDSARSYRVTVTTPRGGAAGEFILTMPPADQLASTAPQVDDDGLDNLRIVLKDGVAEARADADSGSDTILIQGQLISEGSTAPLFVLFSGALAICAMILPGISGAYILVILGQYKLTTSALRDLSSALKDLALNGQVDPALWPALTLVLFFIAGIAIGIFSFVRLLRFLLDRHHSMTMAVLTGLMIGSLRGLWPVNHLHGETLSPTLIGIGVGLTLFGALAIYALEIVSQKLGDPDPPV
ncbi:MAG: DUF368 domain-containing protein [bacterium]|nr:DUF368 domain-containing protein [bacterium]